MGRESTHVDDTGRVYLPIDAREQANLSPGDELQVTISAGDVVLTRDSPTQA